MIARLLSAASAFAGGLFTCAAINDAANGWAPQHIGLAVALTVVAIGLAVGKD